MTVSKIIGAGLRSCIAQIIGKRSRPFISQINKGHQKKIKT